MARRTHSPARWPAVLVLLHWAMAAALAAMLAGGIAMTRAAEHAAQTGDFSATVAGLPLFQAYQLHKSVGVTLFALVLLRFAFRLALPTPTLPGHMRPAERLAARGAHVLLYGLMLGLPISGWLLASASTLGLPTVVFGLFELPHPLGPDAGREMLFGTLHWLGGWALIGSASLHVAAALKHHFVDRDDVLRAMLPRRRGGKERTEAYVD